MKYLVALLLLASYFNLAEFHPIDEIIVSEIADFTKDSSDYLIGVNLTIFYFTRQNSCIIVVIIFKRYNCLTKYILLKLYGSLLTV